MRRNIWDDPSDSLGDYDGPALLSPELQRILSMGQNQNQFDLSGRRSGWDLSGTVRPMTGRPQAASLGKAVSDAVNSALPRFGSYLREERRASVPTMPTPQAKDPLEELKALLKGYHPSPVRIEQPKFGSRDILTGLLPTIALALMNKDAGAVYASGFLGSKQQDAARRTQQNSLDAEAAEADFERQVMRAKEALRTSLLPSMEPEPDLQDRTVPESLPDATTRPNLAKFQQLARKLRPYENAYDPNTHPRVARSDLLGLVKELEAGDDSFSRTLDLLNGGHINEDPRIDNQDLHKTLDNLEVGIKRLEGLRNELILESHSASSSELDQYDAANQDLRKLISFLENQRDGLKKAVEEWRSGNNFLPSGGYLPELFQNLAMGLPPGPFRLLLPPGQPKR